MFAGNKVEKSCLNSYKTSFIFNCHKRKWCAMFNPSHLFSQNSYFPAAKRSTQDKIEWFRCTGRSDSRQCNSMVTVLPTGWFELYCTVRLRLSLHHIHRHIFTSIPATPLRGWLFSIRDRYERLKTARVGFYGSRPWRSKIGHIF